MTTLLEMRKITKTFPGVKALSDVDLRVEEGEIHALVGENGAGKSTLMKVLSGVYPHGSYEGEIYYGGELAAFSGIADSEKKGVIIIHQELALVPQLSIAENIFLGNEVARAGVIDWPETFDRTEKLLRKVGLKDPPATLVEKIGVGKQQLVEIAKALSKDVRLLILDEPTAALSEADSAKLLKLLLELKQQGITSILISHKLNEVEQVADTITVLRDGASVAGIDCRAEAVSEKLIIQAMVGRTMENRYPDRERQPGQELMTVKDWNVWHPEQADRKVIKNVSFNVRAGEIVGIAGLMGAGRTELAMSIFGHSYGRNISGEVLLGGERVDVSTVPKAIQAGLAYVTEDRKGLGLILDEPITRNVTLAHLAGVSKYGVLNTAEETRTSEHYRKAMNIRTPTVAQRVVNLSGGNQQKVVLSKCCSPSRMC